MVPGSNRLRHVVATLATLLLFATGAQQAHTQDRIRLVAFESSGSLPQFVGQELGFYGAEGIELELVYTVSSTEQISGLASGDYDIAQTALDNVVAHQQKADRTVDLFAFMGMANLDLPLIVAPDIAAFGDLIGRTLGVDSPVSGYSLVLRAMLDARGLARDEYLFESVGGASSRWAALQAGDIDGGILNYPFDQLAVNAGFRRLDSSLSVIGPYLAAIYSAREAWAERNENLLTRFIRAELAIYEWILDPLNTGESTRILQARMPALSADDARDAVIRMRSAENGFSRGGEMQREALETALAIRREQAPESGHVDTIDAYVDESYLRSALLRSE